MRKLFFVIGPSGSGKTTLVDYTIEKLEQKYNLSRIPSLVTRPPRDGEINGKSFMFVDWAEFNQHIRNDDFIEWEEYAGLRHGLLKNVAFPEKDKNFIKEITPSGLQKVIKYAIDNGFKDEIVIISISVNENELMERLRNDRNMPEFEIQARRVADKTFGGYNVVADKYIYNTKNSFFVNAKEDFTNFIENRLKTIQKDDFEVKTINKKEQVVKMVNVHKGSTVINHADNANGRFVHVTVDSESKVGVVYYVTADSWTGKIMGCNCPQAGLFPFKKCKHQKAVISRLVGK